MVTHTIKTLKIVHIKKNIYKKTKLLLSWRRHNKNKKDLVCAMKKRQWHPTPALLPGKSHGQRSLVGCCLWGCTESDTTEQLNWTELNWTEGYKCWLLLLLLLLSRLSRVQLCATPETAAHQAPPSLGFSRQEHWSGVPLPSPMHESEKWKWSCSVVSDS